MSNVDYKGSVTLISGLTQANNGSFPLVDGDAVQYKQEINEDGTFKSVSQKLSEFNRSYEYATSDDIDGILNGLFGQWKRLSLTEDTMLENTFEDQLKILSVNGNSYQPTSNNIVPTPEKPIPIISKKTNIKRISPNLFDLEKESDTSKIPDSGTYRSIRSYQLKPDTQYIFSWSSATVPAKGTLSFQIQNNTGTVLVSPFTYFNISSDEKEETGKDVEFTTDSSGIIKFAYNCIVGTSSSLETYQRYWYTKILRDIALKESVLESEQIELRSLKETGNIWDLKPFTDTDNVYYQSNDVETKCWASEQVKNFQSILKPHTTYSIKLTIEMVHKVDEEGYTNASMDKRILIYRSQHETLDDVLIDICFTTNELSNGETQTVTKTFTTPDDLTDCKILWYTERYTSESGPSLQSIVKFKDITLIEGSTVPQTYIPPTVRDYKIVNHETKTAKIVRNTFELLLTGTENWQLKNSFGDLSQFFSLSTQYVSDTSNDVKNTHFKNGNPYQSNENCLGFIVRDVRIRYDKYNENIEGLKQWLSENNIRIFGRLQTPIEEEIAYSADDVSEVGYSWQDTTSPSPTIKSEVKGVEKIDITITGKNLFDIEYVSNLENWTNSNTDGYFYIPIKVPKGKQLCLSNDKIIASGRGYYANFSPYKDKNSENYYFFYHNASGSAYGKFDRLTKDEDIYLRINSIANNLSLFIEDFNHLQLEVGDTATAYEPYKPLQSLSYQLDTPLKGINNTKDIIDIESNQRTDNLTIFVLDDKTTKSIIIGTTKEKTQVFQLDISDIFNDNDIWCDKLKNDRNKDEELFTCQSGNLYIAIYKGRLETVDVAGFKKWLKDNPLTFTGSATTPTQETLLEDLPAELNKLKTNDGSTAIYINGEVKPSLNIEYKGT